VRVPKIPKQKERFDDAPKFTGVELMPKTADQQKKENKIKGVAIKVLKPKLTIKGFVVDSSKQLQHVASRKDSSIQNVSQPNNPILT